MFINWSSDVYCYTALRNALWFKNMNECDFKYWFNHFTDIFRKVYGKGFERKGFTKVIYFTYYAWIYLPSWRLTPRHHYFCRVVPVFGRWVFRVLEFASVSDLISRACFLYYITWRTLLVFPLLDFCIVKIEFY